MKILKNAISIIVASFIVFFVGNFSYAQSMTVVDAHHDWTITFKSKVDLETINAHTILVKQDTQQLRTIEIIPTADQKSVIVKAPPKGYEKGKTYTLHIIDVKSTKGFPLKEQFTMPFTINNDVKAQDHTAQVENVDVVVNDFEYEVFQLVNEVRVKNNLRPLLLHKELSSVAREKSKDLMNGQYFDHISPTYGSPFDMMKHFGITYRSAGENIAGGFDTAEETMVGWMNSPGHRANILNPNYTHIGVGYESGNGQYGTYWTQLFIEVN